MQLKQWLALTGIALFVACGPGISTADQEQARATEQLAAQANAEAGMPGITNFTEKKLVKMLYELRDQEGYATYTYITDMQGRLHLFCESIGYGIPYAVQYSNPQVAKWHSSGGWLSLPQPEPNGLFMPDALSATWIMCVDRANGGAPRPVYVEPQIIVSPFRLDAQ